MRKCDFKRKESKTLLTAPGPGKFFARCIAQSTSLFGFASDIFVAPLPGFSHESINLYSPGPGNISRSYLAIIEQKYQKEKYQKKK